MSNADKILKMIEAVAPDDTNTLDEIDARAWCLIEDYKFVSYGRYDFYTRDNGKQWDKRITFDGKDTAYLMSKYTRSRDALKAIRPDGYTFSMIKEYHTVDIHNPSKGKDIKWFCLMASVERLPTPSFNSTPISMPTEELAELHAIIQATEWERENA